ncbi:uncharacterized protein LOC113793207 [Dermatophagoides pteronyssinus]|uniref:Uncharacterized protein LOC113793207 n=2 Tax=Dermatophagoides pteronyssinus TaxID=6956 RepID=A0A6P6Y0L4_DERPT|nr:uncharacterized protein LOC113793207 [Dermatophagoides pteronyssinus]KAH9423123.1 hypothetical protein DERP_007717 [Dermatophagoides pteronyssinus]
MMADFLCKFSVALFVTSFVMINAEISDSGAQQNKPEFKVLEKDLEEVKERWMELEDWGDDDMMQHPIDEGLRRTHRELGEICTYSRDCRSGCCQLDRETKLRSCQPKANIGEKCTNAQVKADTYVDACPCVAGYDHCSFPKEVCTK